MSNGITEARVAATKNQVHFDRNWAQRVQQESQTETNWNKNWGFMTTHVMDADNDRALKHHSDEDLHERAIKLSATYKYVTTMKSDRNANRSQALADRAMGYTNATELPPPNERSKASTQPANSLVGTQTQALASTRQWESTARITRPNPASLDVGMAVAMQKRHLQAVGRSLELPGVDPSVKYSYPQTRNQEIGWRAYNSLEVFGVAQHGKQKVRWDDS